MIDTNKPYVPPAKYQAPKFNPNKKPAKVKGFTVASFFTLLGIYLAKYVLDFILLPLIFPQLYPFSAAAIIIWIIETIIITALCIKFVSGFGYFYIPACLIYAIGVAIYPNDVFMFGPIIPQFFGGVIAYAASRIIERAVIWAFIGISFIRM